MAHRVVTSIDPWPDDVPAPAPVTRLERLAGEQGWRSRLRYSCTVAGEQMISVRVARSQPTGMAGYAMYRKAGAHSGWAWTQFKILRSGSFPRPLFLLAEFEALLLEGWKSDAVAFDRWVSDFAEIHAGGVVLAKKRDAERKAIRAAHAGGADVGGMQWDFYTDSEAVAIALRPVKGREVG